MMLSLLGSLHLGSQSHPNPSIHLLQDFGQLVSG